jgi:hypothetical protein
LDEEDEEEAEETEEEEEEEGRELWSVDCWIFPDMQKTWTKMSIF